MFTSILLLQVLQLLKLLYYFEKNLYLLISSIIISGTFFLFGTVTAIGTFILYVILPETRGLNLEDVQQLFMSKEYRKKQQLRSHDKAFKKDQENNK